MQNKTEKLIIKHMSEYKFVRLASGWEDKLFEKKLNKLSKELRAKGFEYYDIKITSNGNNSLVIMIKK